MHENVLQDEAAIRGLRTRSNAAIARCDVGQVTAVLSGNATILTAAGELLVGSGALTAYFKKSLEAPSFVMAERIPEVIHINGLIAAEEGRWLAHWKPSVIRGRYMARWEHEACGWKTTAELYIPLTTEPDP
jgi:ketosteroid isomerase-like protein